MNPFIFENPPVLESEDGQILAEYLSRQLLALSASLDTVYNFQDATSFLGKPQDAMLRWFANGAPGNDQGPGYYYWLTDRWVWIPPTSFVVENFVLAGYGGLYLSTPVAGPTIGGAWQTLTQMDTGSVSAPRYVIQDVANNGLVFDLEGVWAVSINLAFAHNEVNSGRTTQIRLRNDDTGDTGPPRLIGTGRNQEVTNYATTVLVEITEAEMHDLWQMQIGNGDTYSSVTWTDQSFEAWHVSEYKPPYTE